jgi:hypothetical protein
VYRALIICNSQYPAARGILGDLNGPKEDGIQLRDALTDHDTGMFHRDHVQLASERESGDLSEAIEDFFGPAEEEDTLLFYYSGHGYPLDQQLYLCARNTNIDRIWSTSISSFMLNNVVARSRAGVKVMILDCCYAALLKGIDITGKLAGEGRYVIAATSATGEANDAIGRGWASPFTHALVRALKSEAVDLDGDGHVDLDDVYKQVENIHFNGTRPHRNFDGAGSVLIARRLDGGSRHVVRPGTATTAPPAHGLLGPERQDPPPPDYSELNRPFPDRIVIGASFSPELVAEFRSQLRSDARDWMPSSLTDLQFLEQAGLMRRGHLTYAGLLLFGDNPIAFVPTALVQCVRFSGTTKTAPLSTIELHGGVPDLITRARDFVADIARLGDAPTTEGARSAPAYRFPMIAVREIIANAIVHRDYEDRKSSVQVHVYDDRIEVINPGTWEDATPEMADGVRLGRLEGISRKHNFILANTLGLSQFVEGVGAGVPRSVEDCGEVGAPEPEAVADKNIVKVTIYPRAPQRKIPPGNRHTHIWGSEIPYRNPNFVGREAELLAIRDQLHEGSPAAIRQPPIVVYGLGGVGKTELATEYAHRYAGDYEMVWWVRADQEDSIQASLVALGSQLRLPDVTAGDRDRSVRNVLNALQSGEPYSHWLLIFDDVTQPARLRRYIPQGSGHVIVTSRISEWRQMLSTNGTEISIFARPETIELLRGRIPQIAPSLDPATEEAARATADRLAAALGDLPLAAEHAAAYLAQTGVPVDEYIEAFEDNARSLLSQDADMFASNAAVSTTWSVSRQSLSPEARELFQLLAYFAPEFISEDLLFQPDRVSLDPQVPEPLRKVLSSRSGLKRAERELARFSLVSLHGQSSKVILHRVVQAVTRNRTEVESPEYARILRETVFALLAASNPGNPDDEGNDPAYERSIQHLAGTGALQSDDRLLRNLVVSQVRRLNRQDAYRDSLSLADRALDNWRPTSDPDDLQVLAMAVQAGTAMRALGQVKDAFDLNADTLRRLRDNHGVHTEIYLACASSYGEDLRLRGRYRDALTHDANALTHVSSLLPVDEELVFTSGIESLTVRLSVAADLRCMGRFNEAQAHDAEVAAELERIYSETDRRVIAAKLALATDLRWLGRLEESGTLGRELADIMVARDEPWNFLRLDVFAGLSLSLRALGYYSEPHEIAEDIYARYVDQFGEDHRATLVAATNLICTRRLVDDLAGSTDLGERTVASWERAAGPGHPNALIARANLAVTLRASGDPMSASTLNEEVLNGFRGVYEDGHANTLAVMTNLASDLAAMGDVSEARSLGERAATESRERLGALHPITLAAYRNLALDLRATGDESAAQDLEEWILAAYDEQLSAEHPVALRARGGERIDLDVEPTAS